MIPSESNVTAEVLEVNHSVIDKTILPESKQNLSRFELRIIESRNVGGYTNFIAVGSNVTAYTIHVTEEDPLKLMEIQSGDTVEGIIEIMGDERGTRTWFSNIKKITPPMELPWMWIDISIVTVAIVSTLFLSMLVHKMLKKKDSPP